MTPNEYLDAAKKALEVDTDYELAKSLEVPRQYVSEYRKARRWPDAYAATKLAITLKLDPAMVIADLEFQRETRADRKAFWAGFLARAAIKVCLLVGTLGLICSVGFGDAGKAVGGSSLTAGSQAVLALWIIFCVWRRVNNVYYVKWYLVRLFAKARRSLDIGLSPHDRNSPSRHRKLFRIMP